MTSVDHGFAAASRSVPEPLPDSPERGVTAPVVAALTMLTFTFLHVGLNRELPNNFFVFLFAAVALATAVWMYRTSVRLRGIGAVEYALAAYLVWNIYSMLAPHKYAAGDPLTGQVFSVPRFIMTGVVIPFAMYVIGRYAFERQIAVRVLLWLTVVFAAYSAAVSIMQFTGPKAWVWPRFIVDGSLTPGVDTWADRALGVFNQPVVNGLIMTIGVAVAMLLASRRSEPVLLRLVALTSAIACGFGIYLTHTRAVWLAAAVMLVLGALLARGFRKGFIVAQVIVAAVILANWTAFTSDDRQAGGIGSASEVDDRLNIIQTGLWAAGQKPLVGWGIQRFQVVNTYHHQQWAPEIPWKNGYGIVSHTNEIGIVAELGLIGLALWVIVLGMIVYKLSVAYRTLSDGDLCGKPLAVIAIIAFAVLFCSGLTVDLRLFDFPTALVFLLVGSAIGWSDRNRVARTEPGGVAATSVCARG